MRALALAQRETFFVAKKFHKKARHISTLSASVVNKHNARTLIGYAFSLILCCFTTAEPGRFRSANSDCIAYAMI